MLKLLVATIFFITSIIISINIFGITNRMTIIETQITQQEQEIEKLQNEIKDITYFNQLLQDQVISDNEMYKKWKTIKHWTKKEYGYILFDSDKHNHRVNTSVFDDKIMNKKHLLFLGETNDGILFGEYLDSEITGYAEFNETEKKWKGGIYDENSFLFSFKSKIPQKFMKRIERPINSFTLWKKDHDHLCTLGARDVWIFKNFTKCVCDQNYYSSFDYGVTINAMVGKNGEFELKRFQVIQMI